MTKDVTIVYGDHNSGEYFIVKDGEELLLVHGDYFTQELAVFASLDVFSDWSDEMILTTGKIIVDLLNKNGINYKHINGGSL